MALVSLPGEITTEALSECEPPNARSGRTVCGMADEDIPKLADWLAEYHSRPDPVEVVVASYDLVEPVPNDSGEGMSAGQVAVDIVRYDAPPGRPGPPDNAHYVMGVNAAGEHLWDDWYESEEAAREVIADGHYGPVVERLRDDG